MHLDLQAANVDISGSPILLPPTNRSLAVSPGPQSPIINTILVAKQMLATISGIFRFGVHCFHVSEGQIPSNFLALSAERCGIWRPVIHFTAAFDAFVSRV